MILDQHGQPYKRASIENPSTNINDPSAFDFLDSTTTQTGMRVNRLTALGHSPIWRGVNLLARDVGKLPLVTYRRVGEGKSRATDHYLYPLLRSTPNSEMTAFTWKETMMAHALLEGNGYSWIMRDPDRGRPLQIIPLLPRDTYPVRVNGRLSYCTMVNGEWDQLDAADVLHIKGLGYDGLSGYSILTLAAEPIGLGLAARNYGSRFFSNNANPDLVIEIPEAVDDKVVAEMIRSWDKMHRGLRKSHRPAVLTNGAKVNPFSVDAKRSQLLETRQFDYREVANLLNIPPHKIGDSTLQGYASLEQENQSYLNEALDPWLVRFEEEVRSKLLTEEEQATDSIVVEFLRQALLRADMAARGAYYATALGGLPWMTRDEVRGMENLNPLGGAAGELSDPANLVGSPAGDTAGDDAPAAKPKPDPIDEPGDAGSDEIGRALELALADNIARAVTRLMKDAERMRRAKSEKRDLVRHAEAIAAQISPVLAACNATRRWAPTSSVESIARSLCAWGETIEWLEDSPMVDAEAESKRIVRTILFPRS